MTTLTVPDGPKMLRETLCRAQAWIGNGDPDAERAAAHIARLQRLIDECDRHRPLGPDGKHGDRHTPTCGCDAVPPNHPGADSKGACVMADDTLRDPRWTDDLEDIVAGIITVDDTLHGRIEAELDRREQIVHELVDAIGDSPWVVEYLRTTQRITNARALIIAETSVGSPLPGLSTKLAPEPEHIALHDPADALRRYAAARRALARHAPMDNGRCDACDVDDESAYFSRPVAWPCIELLDLADSLGLSTTTSEEQRNG